MDFNEEANNEIHRSLEKIESEWRRRAIFLATELNLDQVNAEQVRVTVKDFYNKNSHTQEHDQPSATSSFASFFLTFGGVLLGIALSDLVGAARTGGKVDILTTLCFAFGLLLTLSSFAEWYLASIRSRLSRSPRLHATPDEMLSLPNDLHQIIREFPDNPETNEAVETLAHHVAMRRYQ